MVALRTIILLLLAVFPLSLFSKDIVGTVSSTKDGIHLVGCNVSLLSVKDSSVICGTQTVETNFYKKYSYKLPVQNDSTYLLRFSMVGYKTVYKTIRVKIAQSMNQMVVENVRLEEESKALPEVVVKATKIKMVMKGDTIVYNADAFALAEGSMLDALVSQLPGCRLEKGVIYVNGQRVSSLLVNGRNFFSGDAKLALNHLPAYVVDKVKVYKHDGEASRLMGEDMGDKSLVVDVGLKKKYSVGGVEELKAGIGTHDRYVADLNSMLFGKKADVMINGGTNNIGDLESSQLSENGAGVADKKTMAVAGRFSFKGKTFDDNIRGDYTVGSDRGHQISRTATENYLQGGNMFTASDNDSHDKSSWITSRNFFCKRFKRQIVKASLMVFYNKSRQMGQSRSAMADVKPLDNTAWLDSLSQWNVASPSPFRGAINRVMAQNLTRQTTLNTLMSISSRLAFGKSKGRYGNMIDWSLRLKYNTGNGKTFNINDLYYFDEGSRDFRDNYYDKPSKSYSVNLQASYAHRLTSKADHVNSLFAYFSASVLHAYDTSDNNLYRLDQLADYTQGRYPLGMLPSAADDLFDVLDETNSSHNSSRNTMADGSLRLEMRHGDGMTRPQLTAKLTLPLTWQHERISYTQKRHYGKSRSSALFSPKVEAGYSRTDSLGTRSVNFNYATTPSLPQLLTLLGVRNDDDPLFIRLGNANLRQSRNHTFGLTFNTMSNGKCNTSWALSTGANILQDALGTKVTYDRATGQTTSQQVNVNGNWSANASITLNRGLDANHNLDLSASLKSDYSRNVDLNHTATGSDDAKSKVYTLNTSGSLTLSYHKSRNFMAMLIATVNNNRVTGSRDDFMATNATTYFATAKVMVKLPLGFELTNNINEMKRTGFNDDSMNDNSLVWNARLSKTFLKGALTVNLDAFDILGQISQTQVVMDSQGRTETWANTLPRYVLLHCSYKFNLGKKR